MGATKPEKKEKKDKSSKRSEVDGVSKSSKTKGDKKEKKDKKDKLKSAVLNAALDDKLQADAAAQSAEKAPEVTEIEVEQEDGEKVIKHVTGALVPFALPLADEKATKKILKSVRKGQTPSPCFVLRSPPPFFLIAAKRHICLGIKAARRDTIL
jgi:H/ACA ribonucleoprotein complex subunit 2